ncbi:hypothetical protein [Draconibacterium orientale]|uniref:hypothetical protein n=1 Tax=Draconibacterium orientale TaxID=1168034 RepID=UPI002A0A4429|nr:hypothetical protein [Draconibacterium orientale]
MKLQNKYNYDSTILGLNNQYIASEDGTFYVNHPCILTGEQTLIPEKTYLLISGFNSDGMSYSVVKFIDCYHDNVLLHIFILDVNSQQILNVQIDFNENKSECPWILLDESSMKMVMDKVADQMEVYDYCLGGK